MVRHCKIKVDGRVCGKLDNPYVFHCDTAMGLARRAPIFQREAERAEQSPLQYHRIAVENL